MFPLLRQTGELTPVILGAVAGLAFLSAVHPLMPFTFYFGALFLPETRVPGLGITINQVLGPLFLGSFVCYWAKGRTLRLESALLPALAAMAVYFAVNAGLGESEVRGPVHMRYVAIYFVIAVFLAKSLSSERAVLGLAWIITGVTFLAACHGFVEAAEKNILSAFTGKWTNAVRVRGTAPNAVVFGWNMVFAVPFAFLLYSETRRPLFRNLALLMAMAILAAATLTFNRQTYVLIALVVGLAAVLLKYPNRKFLLTAIAALGVLGALTVFPLVLSRLLTVANLGRDVSFLERRDSFLIGMEMFQRHPLCGVGLGSYPDVWKQYIPADYSTYFSQYNEARRLRFPDFSYMALLAETGLVGVTLFVSFMALIARQAWRLRRAAMELEDRFPANLASTVLVLVTYLAVTSLVQDTFLYTRVWIFYALALLCDPRIWSFPKERPLPSS